MHFHTLPAKGENWKFSPSWWVSGEQLPRTLVGTVVLLFTDRVVLLLKFHELAHQGPLVGYHPWRE